MSTQSVQSLIDRLCTEDPDQIKVALAELESSPELLRGEHQEELLSALFVLFLIDVIDHPELEPIVQRAEALVGSVGAEAIHMVLDRMNDTDRKRHTYLARTLVRIGLPCLNAVIEYHNRCPEPNGRAFALYAISKLRDPALRDVIPLAIKDMTSIHGELRDTATRSLGKIAESVNPIDVDAETRRAMFEAVMRSVSDPLPGVRAKGLRSLQKLAVLGFLDEAQRSAARESAGRALGMAKGAVADPAFVVRRAARMALSHLNPKG